MGIGFLDNKENGNKVFEKKMGTGFLESKEKENGNSVSGEERKRE